MSTNELITIETTRFGSLTFQESDIIYFASPILGFEEQLSYILLDHAENSPFKWLQSVESPKLAFVLTNPALFGIDYQFEVSEASAKMIEATQSEQIVAYTLVTIPDNAPETMTANFLGPIIINVDNRCAMQLVLDETHYSTKVRLLPDVPLGQSNQINQQSKAESSSSVTV